MTLRLPFYLQQLLFVAACAVLFPEASLRAQDVVITQDGKQQQGKVVGSSPSGVQMQIGAGMIAVPLASVKEVRMALTPPEFAQAQKALETKNYDAALTYLRALDKFRALPADWAQQAAAMVGDVYIAKGDLPKAEAAYREFQKVYPGIQGGAQADIGLAKLAVAKKDLAGAKAKVEPIVAKALEDKNVTRTTGYIYSQAFFLMGQIKEAEGDMAGALDNYLKTVAIFYYDRSAVALAQEKADSLRQSNPSIFIP